MTNAMIVTVGNPSPTAAPSPAGADFGSCTTPEIEFGAGFDNRQETSFQPVDKSMYLLCLVREIHSYLRCLASYPHDSAQNINIITRET